METHLWLVQLIWLQNELLRNSTVTGHKLSQNAKDTISCIFETSHPFNRSESEITSYITVCLIDHLCLTKKCCVFHYVLLYEELVKPPYNARGDGGGGVEFFSVLLTLH